MPAVRTLFVGLLGLALTGCGEPLQTRTQTLPTRDRTLAVMVPDGDVAWFFKLSGADAFVSPLEDEFRTLVGKTRFVEQTPRFELPDGWIREGASGMRLATLRPSADSPVEVRVSKLPTGRVGPDEYLKMNFDRWRRELSLPESGGDWLAAARERGEIEDLDAGGRESTWVDLRGNVLPARTTIIFAAGDPSGASVLDLDLPQKWVAKGHDNFRLAIFEAPSDVAVTISSARGGLDANVNRWRAQVGLEPFTDEGLRSALLPARVGGQSGLMVRIVGEQSSRPHEIVGVIAVRGERRYFIKMTGVPDAVEETMPQFKAFLSSLVLG